MAYATGGEIKRFSRENTKDRRPFKPKAWTHQDELKELVGKRIILKSETTAYSGKLVAADQFTLKIEAANGQTAVYFKSAFVSFEEDKR